MGLLHQHLVWTNHPLYPIMMELTVTVAVAVIFIQVMIQEGIVGTISTSRQPLFETRHFNHQEVKKVKIYT